MLIEPCCYNKLIPAFLRQDRTMPMYHIGEVRAVHYIDWLGNASDPGSTMYVIMPDLIDSTVLAVKKAMGSRSVAKENGRQFFNINHCIFITNSTTPCLDSLRESMPDRVDVYESKNLASNLIASTSVSRLGEFRQLVEYGPVVFMGNINQKLRLGFAQLTLSAGKSFWDPLHEDILAIIKDCRSNQSN